MNYPGNPDVAEDVQRRVLSTFESMLREVGDGHHDDALMGCTFIERLDPNFAPAAELRSRIENSSGSPVEVDDLAAMAGVTAPSASSAVADPIETVENQVLQETDSTIELMSNVEVPEVDRLNDPDLETMADDNVDPAGEFVDVNAIPQLDGPSDAPAPAPDIQVGAAGDSVSNPSQPDDRIAALLAEGQIAFDDGEFQTAIDAWSRVFLIDLDHSKANQKIEEARRRLAERDRKAEELFHAGLEKIESGDSEGAQADLVAALALQPNHIGAQEHLERLKTGLARPETEDSLAETPRVDSTAASSPLPPVPVSEASLGDRQEKSGPTPRTAAPSQPVKATTKRKTSLSPRFLIIAGLALAAVVVGAWFVFDQRQDLFPNAGNGSSEIVVRHPIDRAQTLYARGRLDSAIGALGEIPATDARHGEAQALIEKWQAEVDELTEATVEEDDQLSAEQTQERESLITKADAAVAAGLFHRGVENLDRAAVIAPLSAEEANLREGAAQKMDSYADAYLSYRDGDYSTAIAPLWRALREFPDNPAVRDLLVASHFNIARRALSGGDVDHAVESLSEAAKLAPRDERILQALRFSEQYVGVGQDLRYRIFVKYLPQR